MPRHRCPNEKIRISAKRRYVEPWMTRGIERYIKKSKLLYKCTLKVGHTDEDIRKYKAYRNMLNHLKRVAMNTYYTTKCEEYKRNMKKLWQMMNNTISKKKCSSSIIPYISIEGIKGYTPSTISNEFGKFYSSMRKDIASKIPKSTLGVDYYLSKIPRVRDSLVMHQCSKEEIKKIISDLPM